MLSSDVLCLKKRKKKTYSLSSFREKKLKKKRKKRKEWCESGDGTTEAMLQVTEDTPPDMLAGAMDLTVHLPGGRSVKMAVERSTPMMDLLVQITTAHRLRLSGHTLEPLGMSSGHAPPTLPYKPNTPIGTLDTQHVRVVAKARGGAAAEGGARHVQPFESTFRLKVHLPRNQLYVTRVSRDVTLAEIVGKVCEEKNLDVGKYELRHPANLDQTLDLKRSLNDYKITEIYVVCRGSNDLDRTFSTNDIMALRKEEERKQMHNKTGGGVFNLIFRRGGAKSSMGSGSISSDTRSISPAPSDDSRSATPPQQPAAPPPSEPEAAAAPPPRPPARKRRPAPRPPAPPPIEPPSGAERPQVCHSRNSSDSSGYHEASVLSEKAGEEPSGEKVAGLAAKGRSRSTTNLSKMAYHSKSTTSLGVTPGRKKKAAPPPPPAVRASNPTINVEPASPIAAVVASRAPSSESRQDPHASTVVTPQVVAIDAPPVPRTRTGRPVPLPRSIAEEPTTEHRVPEKPARYHAKSTEGSPGPQEEVPVVDEAESTIDDLNGDSECAKGPGGEEPIDVSPEVPTSSVEVTKEPSDDINELVEGSPGDPETSEEAPPDPTPRYDPPIIEDDPPKIAAIAALQRQTADDFFSSPDFLALRPPEIVSVVPKTLPEDPADDVFDGSSKRPSVSSHRDPEPPEKYSRTTSVTSLRSLQGFQPTGLRKWRNFEDLDDASADSWEQRSETESFSQLDSLASIGSGQDVGRCFGSTDSGIAQEVVDQRTTSPPPPPLLEDLPPSPPPPPPVPEEAVPPVDVVSEGDWLPSPPRAFRDEEVPVVERPELVERLLELEEAPLNKLSLENLERRRSLVYNREIANSLKMADTFSGSLSRFESTYAEVQKGSTTTTRSTTTMTSTNLPNFRISTYDRPKERIKVFEDDTVRSNVVEPPRSFGHEAWTPTRPVSRSRSQIALNGRHQEEVTEKPQVTREGVSRSNSLYDVSGLQSLGVMRLIQTKLSTSSPEEPSKPPEPVPQVPRYRYRGPPTINMGTWSERPKVPVSVQGDDSGDVSSRLVVSTRSDSGDVVEVRTRHHPPPPSAVIKIGSDQQRFIDRTTAVGYRRPFGALQESEDRRPRSVDDISRVPIVRSVEFKKPYRNAASSTRIEHQESAPTRRTNSFVAPVVRGFKNGSRYPWTTGYSQTLPAKTHPPEEKATPPPAPPPPVSLPRESTRPSAPLPQVDQRDQLLSAIRNFGGKKGLRSVNA